MKRKRINTPVVTLPLAEYDKMRQDIEDLTEIVTIKDEIIKRLDKDCTIYHRQLVEIKDKYAALIESVKRQEAAW